MEEETPRNLALPRIRSSKLRGKKIGRGMSFLRTLHEPARRSPRASAAILTSGSSIERTLPARSERSLALTTLSKSPLLAKSASALLFVIGEDAGGSAWCGNTGKYCCCSCACAFSAGGVEIRSLMDRERW